MSSNILLQCMRSPSAKPPMFAPLRYNDVMTNLSPQIKKYFWGDDLEQLSWENHRQYIIQTLLEKGDRESISWLMTKASSKELLKTLPQIKLSPKSKNFWKIYLS